MSKLSIVIASTRPGRGGPAVAHWFAECARAHESFEVDLVDLAEVNLPFLDEAEHPRFGKYEKEHTKRWSAIVAASDAFVFVTPEYDYGMPATLLNALQCLYKEWNYKPAAFVSYGGLSGGTRAQQMAKLVVTTLKMMPIPEAVSIPFYTRHLEHGVFKAEKVQDDSATVLLDELYRWSTALKTLRAK